MAANRFLEAIENTYDDLEGWRVRASRLEVPERGSELAADDEVFPYHHVSEVARLSLITAGEHLRLAADALKARQLYPSAHFTVLRGALLAASQGVWVLAPDDRPTRRERGLTVINEMYEQSRKQAAALLRADKTAQAEDKFSDDQRQALEDQIAWLKERKQQVATARTGVAELQPTSFIEAALKHAFPDADRQRHGMSLWRSMSSDAHALFWGVFQRGSFSPAPRGTTLGSGTASGNESDVAQAFVCCFLLLKRGWSLFDRRCEGS